MFKLIFKQFKLDTILFVGISLMDTFLKISAIALFIPLLEYMQGGGNIDLSLWYWIQITGFLNTIGVSLSFISLSLLILTIILINEAILFLKNTYTKYFPSKIQIFLRKILIQSLFSKEYSFLINYSSSVLITFLTTHLNQIAMLYTNLITQLSNIVQMLFLIGFLVTISLKLTIFVIFTLVIIIGITLWKLKVLKYLMEKL